MFRHKTKRITRKAYTGVLKIFSDYNTSSDFTQKYLTRSNHIACCTSDFYSLEKKCIHSQGFSNYSKQFPDVCKFVCPLNKSQVRWYSSNETNDLPLLTSLPKEIMPGFFSPFSNLFITFLVVKPHLDSTFSLTDFVMTSKKVVEIVSHKLAASEIDDMADMVTPAVLQELRTNLPKFSVSQRQELATLSDDIYFSTPSWMTLDNDNERGIKYLHISTLHHSIKGLNELSKLDDPYDVEATNKLKETMKGANKAHLLNYKFTRAYSSEVAGDWLLSGVNHYRAEQVFKFPFRM